MRVGRKLCLHAAGAMLAGGLAVAAVAGGTALTAVARIEPGLWQLKTAGSDAPPRALCIGDAAVLIQYGHSNVQCQRFVIADEANLATVHYTCPGTGHGQTSFKITTARNFTLETQGILNGAPFDEQYEARRTGACAPGAAPLR